MGAQLAAGLACAAQHGVVHGSLTLRHCRLSSRNHVKLTGFDLYYDLCDEELFESARTRNVLPLKVGEWNRWQPDTGCCVEEKSQSGDSGEQLEERRSMDPTCRKEVRERMYAKSAV